MPDLRLTVLLDIDGVPVSSFPLTRRLTVTESQAFSIQRTTGAAFTALPTGEITTIQTLVLQSDKTTAIRLNGVAGEVTVNPNGIVIVFDGSLATAPTLQNNSGSTATVVGIAGGA